jgi:hypothetical protein
MKRFPNVLAELNVILSKSGNIAATTPFDPIAPPIDDAGFRMLLFFRAV